MNYENMTLRDFIEFAEVYEYSQDRYMMEKMLMELDLIKLHLESYEFLLESTDISLSQLDVIMVESGINDKSLYTEQLFIEKSFNIIEGISKIARAVGKALSSLWRAIKRLFTGKNKEVEQLELRNERQAEILQDAKIIADAAGVRKDAEEIVGAANNAAGAMKDQLNAIIKHLNANIGGGGAKILPIAGIDHDSAIRLVIDEINKSNGDIMNQDQIDIYATICQKEYQVEGLAMIANIENIINEISDVIDLKEDTASGIAYNSAKLLQKMGPGYIDRINKICNEIEISTKKNARFTLSEESIAKKSEAADKLNRIFSDLAEFTDIGERDMANPVNNIINRIAKDDDIQARRAGEANNNAAIRMKNDQDMKFKPRIKNVNGARQVVGHEIKKREFLANYPAYLNVLNKLAVKLQSAAGEMSKALTAHINFRNAVIQAHKELTDTVDNVIAASKKS
jgi:hypothetical protein